jgi:hypothetical protein
MPEPHTYPNVAGSNVCMAPCWPEIGETIKGLNNPTLLSADITTFNFGNQSFINSLPDGHGQVFTNTGYELTDGHNNIPEYRHDKIGTPATPAPLCEHCLNGPCIGCHMSARTRMGIISPTRLPEPYVRRGDRYCK